MERLSTADGITKLSKCQDCKRCFLCDPVPARHDCKFEDVIQEGRAAQVAKSKKQTLDNKTSEELDRIAQQDAERMQQLRENRTEEERKRVAQQDAERMQQLRDNRTPEERRRVAQQDAERQQQLRENRTEEERKRVAQQDAERMHRCSSCVTTGLQKNDGGLPNNKMRRGNSSDGDPSPLQSLYGRRQIGLPLASM